ncbi:hypothetical protein BH09BAC1_BH09BAC1_12920 [soil metagenome]
MAENKTKPTEVSVEAFLSTVEDVQKQADSKALIAIMQEIAGEPAKMWGPSIIGFGQYHYKYASGHEGDAPLLGFSPRKANISLYLSIGFADREPLLAKLGKHKAAKACLYIKRLSDVDEQVLRELIIKSYETVCSSNFCVVCKNQ